MLGDVGDNVRKIIFHFLWDGNKKDFKYHLAEWEAISKPKSLGGWGIKNLRLFNLALCAKSL